MDPTMYIFLNAGAGMSTGKAAAQAAHAGVEAYRLSCGLRPHQPQEDQVPKEPAIVRHWYKGGHYKKIVLRASDAQHLITIQSYLLDRGIRASLIVDEGMTEVEPHTPTALGVEVVDKDHPHVAATFSTFDLYRDPQDRRVSDETLSRLLEEADDYRVPPTRVRAWLRARYGGKYDGASAEGMLARFLNWLGREPS